MSDSKTFPSPAVAASVLAQGADQLGLSVLQLRTAVRWFLELSERERQALSDALRPTH